MLKRQAARLKTHIKGQLQAIIERPTHLERRKNGPKREFLEGLYKSQRIIEDRERFMEVATYLLAQQRRIFKDMGPEAFAQIFFSDNS